MVDVMADVQSNSMEAYTDTLRAGVCTKCDHHDDRGVCRLRDSHGPMPTWCTLDAYLNLVVGAVEELQSARAAAEPQPAAALGTATNNKEA
jgi:hypothetical protein